LEGTGGVQPSKGAAREVCMKLERSGISLPLAYQLGAENI